MTAAPIPACPGRRMADGARLGLCITCSRLADRPQPPALEPAARQMRTGGTWACKDFAEARAGA